MDTALSPPPRRSLALDAVRGVAIALVVSFHWFAVPFGWAGVDLFFVLSGYLLGGILIDNRGAQRFFSTFYGRRVLRIVPLYLLFLLIAGSAFGLGLPLWRYLTFTQNFAWTSTSLIGAGPGGLTWSLAVEEQFYLILPLLVRVTPARALPWVALGCVALAPLTRWLLSSFVSVYAPYLLLPGRMDTLFMGVLIACCMRNPTLRERLTERASLVAVLALSATLAFVALGVNHGFTPVSTSMYHLGYSLLAVAFGGALLTVLLRPPPDLLLRLLAPLGVGAYSIYLGHQMVRYAAQKNIGGSPWAVTAAALLGTAVLAVACWLLVEKPLIDRARRWFRYGPPL